MNLLADMTVASNLRDLRILENRHIEVRCIFALVVEPKARSQILDAAHAWVSTVCPECPEDAPAGPIPTALAHSIKFYIQGNFLRLFIVRYRL
jgi:hypothetical protein